MAIIAASFDRDANSVPITTVGLRASKTITFVAGTTGAVGATTLFTITGSILASVFGYCGTNLAGSGTIEVGVAGATASLCDQQSATAIDAHEVWQADVLAVGGAIPHFRAIDQSIIQTIATDTVSGGVLTYYCHWVPLSSNGNLVAA